MLLGSTPPALPPFGVMTWPGGCGVAYAAGAAEDGVVGWCGSSSMLAMPSRAKSSFKSGLVWTVGSTIGLIIFLWATVTESSFSSPAGVGTTGAAVGGVGCGGSTTGGVEAAGAVLPPERFLTASATSCWSVS